MGTLRLSLLVVLALCAMPGAEAGNIGQIKATCRDGDIIEASGVVTKWFQSGVQSDNCIYIEDEDRTAGIRVRNFAGYEGIFYVFGGVPGKGVRVQTGSDGEKELYFIDGSPVASMLAPPLLPMYINNRSIGGGDFHYGPIQHMGQPGVWAGKGLNNIGLLIRTTGRVTYSNLVYSYFYIDDGSHRTDGSGYVGIRVNYKFPTGGPYLIPKAAKSGDPVSKGDYIEVTGISTSITVSSRTQPLIRINAQNDIKWYFWGSGW